MQTLHNFKYYTEYACIRRTLKVNINPKHKGKILYYLFFFFKEREYFYFM